MGRETEEELCTVGSVRTAFHDVPEIVVFVGMVSLIFGCVLPVVSFVTVSEVIIGTDITLPLVRFMAE